MTRLGNFLMFSVTKFSFKSSRSVWRPFGPFESHHFLSKTAADTLRQRLVKIGLLLFSTSGHTDCKHRHQHHDHCCCCNSVLFRE